MELKEKYCFRIFLDDSYGIGVLGKTGRGTCEHYGIPVRCCMAYMNTHCSPQTAAVEFVIGDLGHSLASVGGFCVSTAPNVNHQVRTCCIFEYSPSVSQRLNSSGYCFSASSPPYLVSSGITALSLVQPDRVARLQQKVTVLRQALKNVKGLVMDGAPESPVIHLSLNRGQAPSRLAEETLLQQIVEAAEVLCLSSVLSHENTDPLRRPRAWL